MSDGYQTMEFIKLRHAATIWSSNVDKIINEDEIPVRLCNYTDVYYNGQITPRMELKRGSVTAQEKKRFSLVAGDVLITKDSEDPMDIAVPALVTDTADDIVCGYHLAMLRANDERMRGDFLYWALNSKFISEDFGTRAQGVTRFGLTLGVIADVKIPAPDPETQKEIADFLDRETARIDQLIEKKQQQVELLQEKLKNDVFKMLTRGIDSDIQMVAESKLEWIAERPLHWQNHRLKHFFRENTRYSTDGEEVLFSLRMIQGLVPHNDVSDKEILPESLIGYKKVSPGQIIMNRMRAAIGLFGLANAEGIVSPDYSIFDVSTDAHPGYFLRLFKTAPMLTAFRLLSKGLGTGQSGFMRLNADRFGEVRVAIPEFEEQKKISELVENRIAKVGYLRTQISQSIDRLKEFRAALITNAVTGQIDVATWGKNGVADRKLNAMEQGVTS